MRVLAFGASYSKQSINRQFATYVAKQFVNDDVEVVDLNRFSAPLFTVDVEAQGHYPDGVYEFVSWVEAADFIIISMAEHNGSYTAAFKNLFDWSSRLDSKIFKGAKVLLLSTSPGERGAASVMAQALDRFPRHGADIVDHFSLPSFNDNFDSEIGVTHPELKSQLDEIIAKYA
ncbi:MAG: NAD(P)H-dependent oxidoreductase [Pseudomonadota bacterium]|nr:NAD(P)H-dependent oxidoreductase [Pseudomonadota bacterium]